jgi:hypothetical protein
MRITGLLLPKSFEMSRKISVTADNCESSIVSAMGQLGPHNVQVDGSFLGGNVVGVGARHVSLVLFSECFQKTIPKQY